MAVTVVVSESVAGGQLGGDLDPVVERERVHARELAPGDEPVVAVLDHLPAADRPAQAVQRQPALVQIELRASAGGSVT